RGQIVAGAAGSRDPRPVVAARRVVERDLHESREGDRPVAPDLVADPGHQLRVRGVISVGWPDAPQVHVASLAKTSRSPGPTRLWPPSTTGIALSRADEVRARSQGSAIRSGSRRSLAKRSSGDGQLRSSAPNR